MEFADPRITRLYNKYYNDNLHPYNIYKDTVKKHLHNDMVMLDAGCGSRALVIREVGDDARLSVGVDVSGFSGEISNDKLNLVNATLELLPIKSNSIDIVISRSVLEHLENPEIVFQEINRVLKKTGYFIFLVPNIGDYVSLISKIIPNQLHPFIMSKIEGRKADSFPTYYRANSFRKISQIAKENGFEIVSFEYLSEYPSHFRFSYILFYLAVKFERIINKYDKLRYARGWILAVLRK